MSVATAADAAASRPTLSVVVIVVDGLAAVRENLQSLTRQEASPTLEILVPLDDSVLDLLELEAEFPSVAFPRIGTVAARYSLANAAGQHELIDMRRTRGLELASGELVALLEDRGVPRPDWARKMVEAHRHDRAGVGGGVENGVALPLNEAVFLIDFAHYEPPFEAGPREYISDTNVTYKAAELRAISSEWAHGFQETSVHWAFLRRGQTLWLSPDIVVTQRRLDLTAKGLFAERYHWGRLFATTRVDDISTARRLVYVAVTLLLPPLLWWRILRYQLRRRAPLRRLLRLTPLILFLLVGKCVGEWVGCVTGRR